MSTVSIKAFVSDVRREPDYYLSVILLSVIAYFIVGVFAVYSVIIMSFFLWLYCCSNRGILSTFSLITLLGFFASVMFINTHHYLHTLPMILMMGMYFINKKTRTLWVQNGIIILLLVLLSVRPGIFLMVFFKYQRIMLHTQEWLVGVLI